MTVTIVITTYNHARYLDQALDSVKAQTTPVDEVIVVDDGSDDDPAAVCGRYPWVRFIRQHNQGLAAARNTGLNAATGTFIGFLDADDRLRPTMVEGNLGQLESNPGLAFVYGAYALVDEAGRLLSEVPLRAPGPDAYAGSCHQIWSACTARCCIAGRWSWTRAGSTVASRGRGL